MKRTWLFWGLIFFSAVGVSAATADKAVSGPLKFTYSSFFPPTHVQSQLAESWCREVEKRTGGDIRIDYFAGQTLTKARQCYDGTVEGLSDIGFSVLAYTRGRFPVMSAVDLPLGYTSGMEATVVANQVYEKFRPGELGDTEVMYLHAHGPGLLHTRDKAVRTLDDINGLKIRSHGTSALVVKALGGTPVPKPMPESYQMLQKGVVDGSVYPLESNKGWKLGEVTRYITAAFSAAYTTTFFVVMNRDKWDSIPSEHQATIRLINKEWALKHAAAWDSSDMEGLKYFLGQGGQVIGIDAAESAKWAAAVKPIIDEYIADAADRGINGREVVNFTLQAIEKSRH